MPQALSGPSVQRDQTVRKQIVAETVCAVEIGSRRSRRHENDATLRVDSHAGPIVRRTGVCPAVLGPSVVAELAGTRDGMERPAQRAGANVVGPNLSRSGSA